MASNIRSLKRHPLVESVDQRQDGQSVACTLKPGWTFTPGRDARFREARSAIELLRMVRGAREFPANG